MVADHDHHRHVRTPGVVQVGQAVAQSRTEVQQDRGGLIGHSGISVGRTGGHTLKQSEDTSHLGHGVQGCDEVHLRCSRVGEADPHPVVDKGGQQCLGAVHRSDCRASVIAKAVQPPGRLVEARYQLGHDVGDRSDLVHPADDLAYRHRNGGGVG